MNKILEKVFYVLEDGEGWVVEPERDEEGNIIDSFIPAITIQDLKEIHPELFPQLNQEGRK